MKFNTHSFLCALALLPAPFLIAQSATAQTSTNEKRPAKGASWIELQARTDKAQYVEGEPIQVTLKATNIQAKDAYLKFSSGQRFDLQLFEAGAKEPVYTWSANKMFATMTSHVRLAQGQSETYDAQIGDEMGALKPGKYRLQAHLTNSSQIAARPIEFTVAARVVADGKPKLTATTDKSVYNVGEAVNVEFALQNNAQTPVTLDLRSGQTYDVFVRNAAGQLVWNWGANKRFIMAMRSVTLAAGETQKFSVQWDGQALPDYQVTPGRYTVQAIYASTPEISAAPVIIEIR